ncbi:hypothetical protein [Synechococcus phage BUCT-ZZ01]|nr:hypothetical protein [Synechococcus phage BUCT-ZZ01]
MNIFALHQETNICAQYHGNKHVVKMIIEYGQLLSTAHRVLDGQKFITRSATGRRKTVYSLSDREFDKILYKATHINHPSAIWCRQSASNYRWLYQLLFALCKEYTFRYGRVHKLESSGLLGFLHIEPNKIDYKKPFTYPTPAMPPEYIQDDVIESYRSYYINAKVKVHNWTGRTGARETPPFIKEALCVS